MNDMIRAMEERRSIRKFKPDMPAKEDIEQIIEGEWEGIGHCAVGYAEGDLPRAAKRKDGRVFWAE